MRLLYEVQAWRLGLARLLAALLLPPYSLRRIRAMTIRLGGVKVAAGSQICGGVMISHHNVRIGHGSFVGPVCAFIASRDAEIVIGEGVSIGPGVRIFAVSHQLGPSSKRAGTPTVAPVYVGSGAWIGGSATILPGVVIGDGAVIAAGAVVTQNVARDTVVAGAPARIVRDISTLEPLESSD